MKIRNYKPKFFPFSAGIPWKIERGKYIIPEVDGEIWRNVVDKCSDLNIVCFGGVIESFFSTSLAEALKSLYEKNIQWSGSLPLYPIVRINGICKQSVVNITPDILKKYPVPLFFDRENNAYFNVLHNYVEKFSYWGEHPETSKLPLLKQISNNFLIQGKLPGIRRLEDNGFSEWCHENKIKDTSKIILVLPERRDSIHDVDCLEWNHNNIRELSALVSPKGYRVVVVGGDYRLFHGTRICTMRYELEGVVQVMRRASIVLSASIDWLLMSMIIAPHCVICSKKYDGAFDLIKNAESIESRSVILTDSEWFSPMDVLAVCEG